MLDNEEIIQLIQTGHTEEALDKSRILYRQNRIVHRKIILLSNQYHTLEEAKHTGLDFDSREYNRITKALISIITKEPPSVRLPFSLIPSYVYLITILVILISIGIVLGIRDKDRWNDDPIPKTSLSPTESLGEQESEAKQASVNQKEGIDKGKQESSKQLANDKSLKTTKKSWQTNPKHLKNFLNQLFIGNASPKSSHDIERLIDNHHLEGVMISFRSTVEEEQLNIRSYLRRLACLPHKRILSLKLMERKVIRIEEESTMNGLYETIFQSLNYIFENGSTHREDPHKKEDFNEKINELAEILSVNPRVPMIIYTDSVGNLTLDRMNCKEYFCQLALADSLNINYNLIEVLPFQGEGSKLDSLHIWRKWIKVKI